MSTNVGTAIAASAAAATSVPTRRRVRRRRRTPSTSAYVVRAGGLPAARRASASTSPGPRPRLVDEEQPGQVADGRCGAGLLVEEREHDVDPHAGLEVDR